MKYRQLPIEREFEGRPDAEVKPLVGALLAETMSTKGFQLVTGILRNLERGALGGLRSGLYGVRADLGLGRLQAVEEIRRSLRALLPEQERARVDWFDQEDEGWVTEDPDAPDDDNG